MAGEARIAWVRVSACVLPLATPVSDAKVLNGRQKPMAEIAMLLAEVLTDGRQEGLGFNCSERAGALGQFAQAREIAPALIGGFGAGRMRVPIRPGLGLSLSDQSRRWTREIAEVGVWP